MTGRILAVICLFSLVFATGCGKDKESKTAPENSAVNFSQSQNQQFEAFLAEKQKERKQIREEFRAEWQQQQENQKELLKMRDSLKEEVAAPFKKELEEMKKEMVALQKGQEELRQIPSSFVSLGEKEHELKSLEKDYNGFMVRLSYNTTSSSSTLAILHNLARQKEAAVNKKREEIKELREKLRYRP